MPNNTDKYMKSLSEKERVVLRLAKIHLGSSFDIEKSIGFKKWLKSQ